MHSDDWFLQAQLHLQSKLDFIVNCMMILKKLQFYRDQKLCKEVKDQIIETRWNSMAVIEQKLILYHLLSLFDC